MNPVENFLSKSEEAQLIEAIRKAEKNTSGEIRLHIESGSEKTAMDRAKDVFYMLEMDKTELNNGVLIYLAIESKAVAIIGDKGINEKVPDNFWESEIELMTNHFKNAEFLLGLELAITEMGNKLKTFYPYQSDDINELTDEISKGE